MAFRTSLLALPLLLIGTALAGQGTASDSPAPAQDQEDRPFEPCRSLVYCPDPMKLDSEYPPFADKIPEPLQPPIEFPPGKDPGRARTTRTLVLFQDGKLVQIKTVHHPAIMRGGGMIVVPTGVAPWMAQIQRPLFVKAATSRALNWQDRQFCGGAYIAPGWIVTAAHCLKDYGVDIKSAGYRVRLGVTSIVSPSSRPTLHGASYRIVRIVPHPNYGRPDAYYNDIALIQFAADDETARGSPGPVRLIALDRDPPGAQPVAGKAAWFFGWGVTEKQQPSPNLLYGEIQLTPDGKCPNFRIALCGRGSGPRGSTQCHGDSGGPLIQKVDGTDVLIGLVSHNRGRQKCGANEREGVFTRVAAYRDWIQGFTGPLRWPAARRTRTVSGGT
ncbi:MAG: S1 family peptidase [Novosphingobium sp.]